jgi:formate hydrogenlyase subunit 3/multisubunit Na+/H+ antiporter MnhD subunit
MGNLIEVTSTLPILVFVVPVGFAALIFALGRVHTIFREWLALLGLVITLAISLAIAGQTLDGKLLFAWNRNLYADGLSALMEVLGSGIGIIIVIYSIRYLTHHQIGMPLNKWRHTYFYGLLVLFIGTLNWVCISNSLIFMWVSMEATTLSAAFLVTFYWQRQSIEAGYKYLLLVSVGVTLALLGCVLIYAAAIPLLPSENVLFLTELGKVAKLMPESVVLIACAMFVAGFGTKAGLIPFHAWLPDAHAEAPVPVSALLSGVVITIGAYALARTVTIFAPYYPAVVLFIAILASISMVIGIVMALVQDDLKRLLAYSSISQIAYVIEGLGLGTYLGIYGGLFHLVNHTLVKSLLFLCAGALMYATGSRKISELGVAFKKMPVTAFCFFVGALAIGGLPPFNCFMSKLTLFIALTERELLWAAIIGAGTGMVTVACFIWVTYRIFWTKPVAVTNPQITGKEVPFPMQVSMLVLAAGCILLGVFPNLLYPMLNAATTSILGILSAGG